MSTHIQSQLSLPHGGTSSPSSPPLSGSASSNSRLLLRGGTFPLLTPLLSGGKFAPSTPPLSGGKFPTCQIRSTSRSAFTLVELLVVIAIIAVVSAIAVPAIFSSIASARNAKTKAEVDMLHMALMNYKNEYGSFPPANMKGLWNSNKVNKAHAAYKHIVRIFPRLNEYQQDTQVNGTNYESPYKYIGQLSPAQALVFWLTAFYENPEYPLSNGTPFTNGAGQGNRKKLFDFDESRLYAASAYYQNNTPSKQTFAARGSPGAANMMVNYPVYFTGHQTCGLPYVYFDSRCYDDSPATDNSYSATSTTSAEDSIATPYINSLPPTNGTWGQQHMAADAFQLIAAGKDGLYGSSTTSAAYPASASYTLTWLGADYVYPSPKDLTNGKGHADNITNFAGRPLADAIEALQSQ